MTTPRLGEIFVSEGLIAEEQLEIALRRSREYGLQIGQALLLDEECSEQDIADALARKFQIDRVDLQGFQADARLISMIRRKNIERLRVVPVAVHGEGAQRVMSVATAHPENLGLIDELRAATGMQIQAKVATESEISDIISEIFGHDSTPITRDMSFIHVVIHQFTAGSDRALLLQEGRTPTVINERRRAVRPEEMAQASEVQRMVHGHRRTLDQYRQVRPEDLQEALGSILSQQQMRECATRGGIETLFWSDIHGRFKIAVANYRTPGESNVGAKEFPYTVRIDRVFIGTGLGRSV